MNLDHLNALGAAELASLLATSTVQSVGWVLAVLAGGGILIYAAVNILTGRREAGSEIELAPNRKPYLSDEQLETTKLNWTLGLGLVFLLIIAVGLPLYWLAEPGPPGACSCQRR
jgi:hypothetical protein